ncbi:hypothetical protein XBKB1_3300018 [Xenorhabdus bovienii str. kraussei Becker Underwood]|uniref:Uncharacterized protein n=1 Tax=Xenorhabdus bovienii str. kraussei Becker Underwood TaxID=1398204 RepID=A0A077PYN3_XENBV|nr:hypothetical protein XBKB1_3300018 [Xenorhabdus bovienii str. kraussei Becker Underwood]
MIQSLPWIGQLISKFSSISNLFYAHSEHSTMIRAHPARA